MDTLSEETWDVVIAGTSLSQSLLALALSKCDLKVLHVDQNDYYGGIDAGLSLDEAQRWVDRQNAHADPAKAPLSSINRPGNTSDSLGPSRAYTVSLNPQIIYAKSRFLPTLVSSQLHTQLEFQAVGSFFILSDGRLQKIPSNREDVFADDTLSVRDKRKLMGLLRHVVDDQDEGLEPEHHPRNLQARLQSQFNLPDSLIAPVQALTLSTTRAADTSFDSAIARLKRHLMSMGYFGPGLAAVMAKYGGNSEVAQVACRAGAVGGFTYLLGFGLSSAVIPAAADGLVEVELSDGTRVKTNHLVGTVDDPPLQLLTRLGNEKSAPSLLVVAHNISIISSPLRHLFRSSSEVGTIPAVAIILIDSSSNETPIYLQVHSEDTGECPADQCVIYATTLLYEPSGTAHESQARLKTAIDDLVSTEVDTAGAQKELPEVLWSMTYTTQSASQLAAQPEPLSFSASPSDTLQKHSVIVLPTPSHDLAFDDSILDNVKAAWEKILGDRSNDYDFLQFEERRQEGDEQ